MKNMKTINQPRYKSKLKLIIADSFLSRMLGLLGTKRLNKDCGIIIRRCNFIHTFGMQYSLDVIFLDNHLRQLKRVENLKPWRIAYCSKAENVVELNAGFCAQHPDYLWQIQTALNNN